MGKKHDSHDKKRDKKDHKKEHKISEVEEIPEQSSKELSSDKRFGREIAFGLQQTLVCWATDFIDPFIGKWYQNKFGKKEHQVTHTHTWGGEIAGDSAAIVVYLAAKRLFTKPVDAFTHRVEKALDPLYNKMGKEALSHWRIRHHLNEGDPVYKKKLERYKEFQAENLVDSSIIALSSTAINVGAQRHLGNKQAIGLIFTSKIIGAAITMAGMLGLRGALPTTMRSLDDELSERYFSKVIRGTKRAFGVYDDAHTKKQTSAGEDVSIEDAAPAKSFVKQFQDEKAQKELGSTQSIAL